MEELVEKSIREASRVYYDLEWNIWAQTWLSGERSAHPAEAQWLRTERVFEALISGEAEDGDDLRADRALAACYAAEAAFYAAIGDRPKTAVAADQSVRFSRYVLAVDTGEDAFAAWDAAFDDVSDE
jgi:hypothetical protein